MSFCEHCLILFINPEETQKIIETSPWYCFFCSDIQIQDCVLEVRDGWQKNVLSFCTSRSPFSEKISHEDYSQRSPIKILSLFDGISTGKFVMDSLDINIDKYYASEIDEDAIHVSKFQHLDKIIHLGNINHLTSDKIKDLCPLDLVIGGSPCNDLSLVNPARKGLFDFTGTGILFFDFFHILNTVRRLNKGRHVFFLYENVTTMSKKDKVIISKFLMIEPVVIDAIYFSPQRRARYFWGNIPGMVALESYWNELIDKGSVNNIDLKEEDLNKCLLSMLGRKALVDKINTVTTKRNSLLQGQDSLMPVDMNGETDVVWVTELERIFGFSLHYTDTGNLTISKRRELLGKAWSVPVVKNILRPLRHFFDCKINLDFK